jgi:hypothetical protein
VFDRTAEGRSLKNLTIVDDATHEEVAIVPERVIGENQLVRIHDQLVRTRGLPKTIRTNYVLNAIGRLNLALQQRRDASLKAARARLRAAMCWRGWKGAVCAVARGYANKIPFKIFVVSEYFLR